MKIYSSSQGAKKPKAKLLYSLVAIVSVAIIVTSVVLTATFSSNSLPAGSPPVTDSPSDGETGNPTVKDPVLDTGATTQSFTLPLDNGSVIRGAALDKLVYMSSLNMWKTHSGVDFAAAENTPVKAILGGKVVSVEETTLEGVVVSIEHDDGITSIYKSLSSSSVTVGDTVAAGSVVGIAGTMLTEKSDGVHLHLEMSVNGELVDPLLYLDAEINK